MHRSLALKGAVSQARRLVTSLVHHETNLLIIFLKNYFQAQVCPPLYLLTCGHATQNPLHSSVIRCLGLFLVYFSAYKACLCSVSSANDFLCSKSMTAAPCSQLSGVVQAGAGAGDPARPRARFSHRITKFTPKQKSPSNCIVNCFNTRGK